MRLGFRQSLQGEREQGTKRITFKFSESKTLSSVLFFFFPLFSVDVVVVLLFLFLITHSHTPL